LKAGESVAIDGGGGGLGNLRVQFVKVLSLHVITIDARDEGFTLAKECGADTVIDARKGKKKVVEQVIKPREVKVQNTARNVSDHDSAVATSTAVTKMRGISPKIA
jgi:propanol-preferring alcohol dehydrogenase